MHILYIHQYFATPKGSSGTRSYEFARRWVTKGHKVTMLTTTAQLTYGDLKNSSGRLVKKVAIEGFDVLALRIPYRQQMGIAKRILSFLAFSVISSVVALFIKNVDVVFATSTPLPVGVPALVAKWLKRIPFVFEVREQWPEVPIEYGIIQNSFFIKIVLWLEKTIYKKSSAIVTISPGQADGIKKVLEGLKEEKPLIVIPNACDIDMFSPDVDGSTIRCERGWGDKLVLLHAGAMGKVNSLGFIVDAAERLKEHSDIMFVLIGEGGQKSALEGRVKELGLTNVEILPAVPKEKVTDFFAAADVALVIIGKFPISEHNSANKFFDSLSAGKPVLLNYSGWQRKILEENESGFGCDLCNLDEFVEKVLYLNSHRQQVKQMGQNAWRVAVEKFDRDKLAQKALGVIESVKV